MWVWILAAIGLIILMIGIYYLINMDKPSDSAKSSGGLRSVKNVGGASKPCTPRQLVELTRAHEAGTLKLPYPCDTAGVNMGGLPTSPEFRFAAQIAGVQPMVDRYQCSSYAVATLGSLYESKEKREQFENEVCGWRRGRPGCSYADRFTHGNR